MLRFHNVDDGTMAETSTRRPTIRRVHYSTIRRFESVHWHTGGIVESWAHYSTSPLFDDSTIRQVYHGTLVESLNRRVDGGIVES